MPKWLALMAVTLFAADADVPRLSSLRQPDRNQPIALSGETIALFPLGGTAESDDQGSAAPKPQTKSDPSGPLSDSGKLDLVRYVSGEFAKAVKSLPGGKDGFTVYVNKPFDEEFLDRAVATHGAAVHSGDNVQITHIEFSDKQIVVDLNGGGRGKKRLRDRIHIEMGGVPTVSSTPTTPQETGPPGVAPGQGSTLFLDFGKTIPNLSPDDLKQLLSPFLDFRKQRSAAVQWFDTLPAEMKKAITDRKPVVGMDREMVVAAIGKPDHKVRERDSEGNDIEDWIYGQPPSKTIFVRFSGEKVTSIKQFPQ
jgi:hypothetical protein